MRDRDRISSRRGRVRAAAAVAGVAASIAAGGCGAGITVPKIPKMKFPSSQGGSAAFDIDGTTFSVSQSGHISASFPDAPQLTYSGPLGCKGRYFTAHYTEHIEVFFRYSSQDAYLLIDNGADPVFHFSGAPRRVGQFMFWKRSFGGRRISIRVTCPS
jgi:hypothetical protein